MKKFISYIFLGCIPAMLMGQFAPPTSNSAVMVNESTQLVNPTASELLDANPEFEQLIYDTAFVVDGWQIIVDTTPSINPNDYISETSKNITIQTPYYDISELKRDKLNIGEYLSNGGKIQSKGSINLASPYSYAMTFSISQDEWDSMSTGSAGFGNNNIASGIGWGLQKNSATSFRMWVFGVDTSNKLFDLTMSQYLDSKPHTFVITYSNGSFQLFIDGVLSRTLSITPKSDSINSSNILNIQNFYGKFFDVKVFNFDMSAEDTAYTVSDYVASTPVPLTLRNGGGEVLELADTCSAYQIKDLSGNGNHAVIFGDVISRYNENPTAMQVSYSWGSGVSTGAYIMGDTVTLPANSQIEIIGYSSTSMTLNVGSGASASTSFASAASIGTTPSSICTFYTGSSAQELYITPSVAGASINLTIKVTQIE